jgi:inhibitor of cysteine peptidase
MNTTARKHILILLMAAGLVAVWFGLRALAAHAQGASPMLHWQVAVRLSDEARQAIEAKPDESLGPLDSRGVAASLDDSQLMLAGDEGLSQLRSAVFDDLPPEVDFLGGSVLVTAHVAEAEVSALELRLQMRPGAGYRWEVLPDPAMPYSATSEVRFSPMYAGDGAPAVQAITLQPTGHGEATIRLLYQRPFGSSEEPHAYVELWFPEGLGLIELSDETPAASGFTHEVRPGESGEPGLPELDGLPTSWDWRTQFALPAVRNQASCGSCWAFAAVGAMESALVRESSITADLSEQFLVSCNSDGWNCSGGGTAHKYHYDTLGINQTEVGAVLEADKPYTATNGTCTEAYDHPYSLTGWSYVAGGYPSVDQLKNAIYEYGPIKVSVCAESGWQTYPGGVYLPPAGAADTYCSGYTNHAVVLVGWNDNDGGHATWIVRNSWGESWGESGYMRIAWDSDYSTSNIGMNASWVTVPAAAPGAFGKSFPADAATDVSIGTSLTWEASSGATNYEYCVDDSDDDDCTGWTSVGASTSTTGSLALDPATTYFWQVRALNALGTTFADGSETAFWSFTTTATPASVLLVDDDDNNPDVRSYYTGALDELGVLYDVWNTGNSDYEPTASTLANYRSVVWFSGHEYNGYAGPGSAGEADLGSFLDDQGCLLISSQDYYYDRGLTTFMQDYLGVDSDGGDVWQTVVTGSGSIFGGLGPSYTLSYPFANFSDAISPDATAELAFSGDMGSAAINKTTAGWTTAFLGFPIEALPSSAAREEVLEAFLEVCEPVTYIDASALDDFVRAMDWPMGAWLTLDIDDPDTAMSPDYTDAQQVTRMSPWDPSVTYVRFDLGGLDVRPGFGVSVEDGTTERSLQVSAVEITAYDLDLNIVSGVASPGELLEVHACGIYGCPESLYMTSDPDTGSWSADLSPVDIVDGDWLAVHEWESDGDGTEFSIFVPEANDELLLVDDDDNLPDVEAYYEAALDDLGVDYATWDTENSDLEPPAVVLESYKAVIWFSGDEFNTHAGPGASAESSLGTYLDGGGCFLISSQDYFYDRGLTPFMQSYLGVESATSDVSQTVVSGAGGIFGGLGPYSLSYPFSNYSDRITPAASGELAFSGNALGSTDAGVDKYTAGLAAYLGFPIEALPTAVARQDVLAAFLGECGIAMTGSIEGTVTDLSGSPLSGYSFRVQALDGYFGPAVAETCSDPASGAYTLTGVPAGMPLLVFAQGDRTACGNDSSFHGFDIYHSSGNVNRPNEYTELILSGGSLLSNIDLFLGEAVPAVEYLVFNLDEPVLTQALRQAIAYGTDRQGMMDLAWKPNDWYGTVEDSYLPAIHWTAAPDAVLHLYPYNPNLARAMLNAQGWIVNPATGIREKGGEPLTLDLKASNTSQPRMDEVPVFVQQMLEIGIQVIPEILPSWEDFLATLATRDFDIAAIGFYECGHPMDETCSPFGMFYTGGEENVSNYSSAAADDEYEQAHSAPTRSGRLTHAINHQVIVMEDLPQLPLFTRVTRMTISGNAGTGNVDLGFTNGSLQTATADVIGNYTITLPLAWSGTVTPSRPGYSFLPASRTYSKLQAHEIGQDYTAAHMPTAPTVLHLYPLEGSTNCRKPLIGVRLLLTDLVRTSGGAFDPSKVTLTLDNGGNLIGSAAISQTLTQPASHALILYTPPGDLPLGKRTVRFTYPTPTGTLTRTWNFTAGTGACTTSAEAPGDAPAVLAPLQHDASAAATPPSARGGYMLHNSHRRALLRR